MELSRKEIGTYGEKVAAKYLYDLDYKIIKTNYRCRFGEIDIIAYKNNTYVFTEVKTRRTLSFGRPIEAINKNKRDHILKVAQYYIQSFHLYEYNYRFDGIEILYDSNNVEINHVTNIFQ